MTYYELLQMLRAQVKDPPSPVGYPEENELVWRLKTTRLTQINEWAPIDIVYLFRTSGVDLNKQIPCRHCR